MNVLNSSQRETSFLIDDVLYHVILWWQFKTISAKLPPQDDMIKDIIYQERHFPLRTVQDIHGIYLVSSKELEESLIEGVRNQDAAANELLDGICLFCSTQELRYLTDAELIETIYAQ